MIKIKYNSPVILSFALISLLVLILGNITGGASTSTFFCVYRSSWADPLTYLRLFTHVLGHADWAHYFSNMMYILLLGPILEEKYSSHNMLYGIMLTALVTAAAHLIFGGGAMLGASGVVFMLILLASFASFRQGTIPLTFLLIAGIYIGNEIISGIAAPDNISQMSHIIGGACGALLGSMMNVRTFRRR
jgi:GlpG protein